MSPTHAHPEICNMDRQTSTNRMPLTPFSHHRWGGLQLVGGEVRKCLSAFSGRPAGKRIEARALGIVTAACKGAAKGAPAALAMDAAAAAATLPLIGSKSGEMIASERLAKNAWPILRDYMSEKLRGESPSSEAVGLASAAVPACALLARLLSEQAPARYSAVNLHLTRSWWGKGKVPCCAPCRFLDGFAGTNVTF